MKRHDFLRGLHKVVQPRTYLEIGVNRGASMTLSRTRSIGIDPAFSVTQEILCDVHLARTTSDEFFARKDPLAHFDSPVIDLAFIDGMHLAEYALRDFINVERYVTPASVIVLDDVLPRDVPEAARDRKTADWAGDVYKVTDVLREHRPDLTVVEVDTTLTGTLLILGPDAASRVLLDAYDSIAEELVTPDPQDVPSSFLTREHAANPEAVLSSNVWAKLRKLRSKRRVDLSQVREAIRTSDLPQPKVAVPA